MSGIQQLYGFARSALSPVGQQAYTVSGNYTWVAPAGVTSVSVVAVGGGGNGGCGGALAYKNNIAVTAGSSYTVSVSSGVSGTDVYPYNTICYLPTKFIGITTVAAGRLTYRVGDGGGNGGAPYLACFSRAAGGAGGYSGNGGAGGANGAGGGGGGGGISPKGGGGGGGGVGLLGQGASGVAGIGGTFGTGGTGGSGGATGGTGVKQCGAPFFVCCGTLGLGGKYGGGGGGCCYASPNNGGLRIIWGTGRAFPSTCTQDK